MSGFFDRLLGLHGFIVYAIVGLLVFAEDAILVGLVVPGETAAILGGVAASRGNVNVVLVAAVVVVGAVLGDAVGYEIGVRYGSRLSKTRLFQQRQNRIDAAEEFLRRRGGPAVFLGRFIAFLAGTSRMRYRRFFVYNFAGGAIWGVGCVLLGEAAGSSYKVVERVLGPITAGVVAVVVVAGLIVWQVRRRRAASRSTTG
jgi:membrane-associated protein